MTISTQDQTLSARISAPAAPRSFERIVADTRAGARSRIGVAVYKSLAEAEISWRAFEADAICTGFQTFDWLKAWHSQVGAAEGVEPAIALVSLDGQPVMLTAFGIERRLGLRCLVWLGGKFADYKAPMLARDFATRVSSSRFTRIWENIQRALPAHDFMALENQPDLIGDQPNPFAALGGDHAPDAGYLFRLPATYDEFVLRFRPETRRTDRSKERKLSKVGALEFRIAETGEEARRMVADILDRKAAQLRAQGIASIFEDAGYRAAYIALAALPPKRKLLQVAVLTLDGEFLSGSIAHVRDRHATLMVHTYENHFAKMSPGRIHLLKLIKASIDEGHVFYDLSVGYASYKDSFCDTPMALTNLVTAARPWGVAAASAERARLDLKRRVKSNDRLMGWLRALRHFLLRR